MSRSFSLAKVFTPQTLHVYVIVIETSTRDKRFNGILYRGKNMALLCQLQHYYDYDVKISVVKLAESMIHLGYPQLWISW
jgi:hypothetical protein